MLSKALIAMTKNPLLAVAAVALLSLAACNQGPPQVVDTRDADPQQDALSNAVAHEPPPAIAASVTFRCQPDNTLLYVDFMRGDQMATLRVDKTAIPTILKAPTAGEAYVADGGFKLTGNAKAATIVLADGSSHSCKA